MELTAEVFFGEQFFFRQKIFRPNSAAVRQQKIIQHILPNLAEEFWPKTTSKKFLGEISFGEKKSWKKRNSRSISFKMI